MGNKYIKTNSGCGCDIKKECCETPALDIQSELTKYFQSLPMLADFGETDTATDLSFVIRAFTGVDACGQPVRKVISGVAPPEDCDVVDAASLVYNDDGSFTFTDNEGNDTTISVHEMISDTPDNGNFIGGL